MSSAPAMIEVDVVQAWPERAFCVRLRLPADSTVGQALAMPSVRERFPGVLSLPFGVHGQRCDALRRLHDGDQIELYRPLLIDPKAARRERAAGSDNK